MNNTLNLTVDFQNVKQVQENFKKLTDEVSDLREKNIKLRLELEKENKKLVDEYGKLSEMWQIEHAEKLTLIEKLKFAEERIKYLRATIMNEIEDEPTIDTESMMFYDKNGG
ncbi:MAG: hypothetical protein WC401_11530 [Bacteroidales bacterium]